MHYCPNCAHRLDGFPGCPERPLGEFTAAVRCPECNFEVPRGARVLVGAAFAAAVGGRHPNAVLIGIGAVAYLTVQAARGRLGSVPQALASLRGARFSDPSAILLLAAVAFGVGFLIWTVWAGIAVGTRRDPAAVTDGIRFKLRWLVAPGSLRVFRGDPATTFARAVDGSEVAASASSFSEVPAEEIRAIDIRSVNARVGLRGSVVRLTARFEGKRGDAAMLHIVTAEDARTVRDGLLATLRRPRAQVETPEWPGLDPATSPSGSPTPDRTPRSSGDAAASARSAVVWSDSRIVLHGSPFEPRLSSDRTMQMYSILLRFVWFPFALVVVCGLLIVTRTYRMYGIYAFVLCYFLFGILVYGRWRSGSSRWTAESGELRIERFTQIIPGIGPWRQRIRAAHLGEVFVSCHEGVEFLCVSRKGSRKVKARLVPADLGGRSLGEVAEALEGLVRFGAAPRGR
jgi:hypothetical protein